jgi:hypothetical protein
MKHLIIVISAACSLICAHGQTLLDLRTQTRDVDFSVSPFTRPVKVGAGLPVTCGLGDLYFRSDVTPGGNLYGCTASDTWTQMSSSPATLPGSSTYSAGLGLLLAGTAFGADFSVLPGLALSNTWSNMNDFSLGQLRVQVGAGVPSSLTCASSSNVGKIYVRSDAQANNASHYSCNQTGVGVYSWELTQSSGGGGGGTLATASTPVFSPPAGSYSSTQNVSITCLYGSPYYTVGGTSVAAYGSAINKRVVERNHQSWVLWIRLRSDFGVCRLYHPGIYPDLSRSHWGSWRQYVLTEQPHHNRGQFPFCDCGLLHRRDSYYIRRCNWVCVPV